MLSAAAVVAQRQLAAETATTTRDYRYLALKVLHAVSPRKMHYIAYAQTC